MQCYGITDSSSTQTILVNELVVAGNKYTRTAIIARELAVINNVNYTLVQFDSLVVISKNNLYNTGLFAAVEINYSPQNNTKGVLLILVTERIRFLPLPVVELADRNPSAWFQHPSFSRVNYGLAIIMRNLTGRNESYTFGFKRGFNNAAMLEYFTPSLGAKLAHGFGAKLRYATNNQLLVRTLNNKAEFYKAEGTVKVKHEYTAALRYVFRPKLYATHTLLAQYTYLSVKDTVLDLNPNFSSNNGTNTNTFFTLNYEFKLDRRDYKNFPLRGYFIDAMVQKDGLNILKNENVNTLFATLQVKKFIKLNTRLYYAIGAKVKKSNDGYQPYFMLRGLGYGNDLVRGFEYYNIDAKSYFYVRHNLKYALIKPNEIMLAGSKKNSVNVFRYGLFVNLFNDIGQGYNALTTPQPLTNKLLYSTGIGIDFITSYDACIRIEYTLNNINTRGVYVSFVAPI